ALQHARCSSRCAMNQAGCSVVPGSSQHHQSVGGEYTMKLEGSCHCGAVHFSCESKAPYPFMRCYCSICRKTGGGGGYAINLHADADTLEVTGEDAIRVYRAWLDHPRRMRRSTGERRFCGHGGTAL